MRISLIGAFIAEVLLVIIGVIVVIGPGDPESMALVLTLWDLIAICFVVIGFLVIRRRALAPAVRQQEHDRRDVWDRLRLAGPFRRWFPPLISLIGLAGGLNTIIKITDDEAIDLVLTMCGLIAIVLSWALLHAGYAGLYRWLLDARDPAALRFPDGVRPNDIDLLYFSFTIGTSFAVSDVETTTSSMRWRVLMHMVLSFFYNAIVLALAFKFLTGG